MPAKPGVCGISEDTAVRRRGTLVGKIAAGYPIEDVLEIDLIGLRELFDRVAGCDLSNQRELQRMRFIRDDRVVTEG